MAKETIKDMIRVEPELNKHIVIEAKRLGISKNTFYKLAAQDKLNDLSNKELLEEIKKEFKKMKQEIINEIKQF